MLPGVGGGAFIETVTDAVDLAAEGKPADGYRLLREACERAERLREGGEPRSEELVRHYTLACVRFANRYGLPPR